MKNYKAIEYADWWHTIKTDILGTNSVPEYVDCRYEDIRDAFTHGWESALHYQWVMAKDRLPDIGLRVVALTKNGKMSVTFRYIPKDIYGNVLSEPEWNGSRAFGDSIIAWMSIPPFDEILQMNKDVLRRMK